MKYSLENYEEQLTKQLVHMDQGISYCPEFTASRAMHNYPSRKMQLARALFKGELPPSQRIEKILFTHLLSRQGERWQNFGESPEDFTDVMILARALLQKKSQGHAAQLAEQLKNILSKQNSFAVPVASKDLSLWQELMPVAADSKIYLLLDDASCALAAESAEDFSNFFRHRNIAFHPEIKARYCAWEYFAYGLIDEGIQQLQALLRDLETKGIDTILTLSPKTQYILGKFSQKIGVQSNFKIINILDLLQALHTDVPVYAHGGSFLTRYLGYGPKINRLLANSTEEPISNSIEFNPLVSADKRVNVLTIWQRPVSAEFLLLGFPEDLYQRIQAAGISDVQKGTQEKTVVFNPYDFNILRASLGSSVLYFSSLLSSQTEKSTL